MHESKETAAARPSSIEEAKTHWSAADRERLKGLVEDWKDYKETKTELGEERFEGIESARKTIADTERDVIASMSGLRDVLPTSFYPDDGPHDLNLFDLHDELDALEEALKDA